MKKSTRRVNICCVGKALGSTILSGYLFGDIGVSEDMDGMSSADTAFKLFDKDRDGFITRAEFSKVTITCWLHQ